MAETFDDRWRRLPHVYAVVDVATSQFVGAAFPGQQVPVGQLVVDLGINTTMADLVRERYDPTANDPQVQPYLRRPATPEEQASVRDAQLDAVARDGAGRKDLLATCALLAKTTDPVGWTAMTLAQKIARVRALADEWRGFRVFVERNL